MVQVFKHNVIVETEDGVTMAIENFIAKRIFLAPCSMHRTIKFDDETKFMTVKISDEETLPPIQFEKNVNWRLNFSPRKLRFLSTIHRYSSAGVCSFRNCRQRNFATCRNPFDLFRLIQSPNRYEYNIPISLVRYILESQKPSPVPTTTPPARSPSSATNCAPSAWRFSPSMPVN